MSLPSTVDPEDEPILEEVQDNFTDDRDRMEPIKTQADIDMRFVDGDGWDPSEKIIRDAAGRPRASGSRSPSRAGQRAV